MRMHIAAIATTLVITVSPLALALAQQGGQHGKGPNLERMQQHLNLSDEQVEQIRQIKAEGGSREDVKAVLTEEQQQKMAEQRKKKQGHKLERMQQHLGLSEEQVEQIREIRANGGSREDIEAVMTEEQQQLWAEHRKKMKGKHKGQGRGQSS